MSTLTVSRPAPPPTNPPGSTGVSEKPQPRKQAPTRDFSWLLPASIVLALCVVAFLIAARLSENGEKAREDVRANAEKTLEARFNDVSVQPPISANKLTVFWSENDVLKVRWEQGNMTCVSNVMLPTREGELVGIEPVSTPVPVEQLSGSPKWCASTYTSNGLRTKPVS